MLEMGPMEDCVFCRIVDGKSPGDRVYEDELVLAFLDIAPLNKGHTLIVPKEHHNSATTVPAPCLGRMMAMAPRIGAAMMRATDADGFNLVLANGACAGQVVPHVHLHVIPRHPTDGIVMPARTVPYQDEAEKQEILRLAKQRLADGPSDACSTSTDPTGEAGAS